MFREALILKSPFKSRSKVLSGECQRIEVDFLERVLVNCQKDRSSSGNHTVPLFWSMHCLAVVMLSRYAVS